jgi:hypothetical protein
MPTMLVFTAATDRLSVAGGVPNTHTASNTVALCDCHTPPRPAVLAHAHGLTSGPRSWVHRNDPWRGWTRGAIVRGANPGQCAGCAPTR